MILDKKGKLFGKISIVDLAFILVILIAIGGIFFTKAKLEKETVLSNESNMLIKSDTSLDTLQIKMRVKEVRDVTRDAIVVGDSVYVTASDKQLGTVKEVSAEPAMRNVISDNGTVYQATVPDRYDVTIVVEASGKQKEDGFYTDSNIQLLFGREMEITTSTIQTTPQIVEITVADKETSSED